jgi:hypothetical protein
MAQGSACFFCGMENSWRHSLLECNMARCIWTLEKEVTVELLSGILENDAKSWSAIMAEILPQEDIARVAITLWAIWFARRKVIHEDVYRRCFVNRSSKFIRLQHCSRKMMVASKRHDDLY